MKNFRNIYFLQIVAGMLLLASCSNEEYLGGHYTTDGAGVATTITATAPDGETWAAGTRVGISTGYATYDASARNREYVSESGGNGFVQATGAPIYVKGNTSIVAYYPFVGIDGAEPTIILNTKNQDNLTNYYFSKTDGITIGNGSQVTLNFHRALARLQLNVTVPDGETIKTVRISGFAQEAEVDPFTLDMKLSNPEDFVIVDNNIRTIDVQLIPQTITAEAAIPARLVLVGSIRSYSIDMGDITLTSGEVRQGTVDVTNGVGTLEFVPADTAWTDSGMGGHVDSY